MCVMMNKHKYEKFQTDGAVMLKLLEANVVQIRGTNNRLVLEKGRERAEIG